jgi:hypothetical protein
MTTPRLVSARHLSFVETGRSKPGAEIILRLAEHLELPLRERNRLLLAAGHAPAFPDRSLQHPAMGATAATLELILAQHEPYPAMVIDRHWNLVSANQAAYPGDSSTAVMLRHLATTRRLRSSGRNRRAALEVQADEPGAS